MQARAWLVLPLAAVLACGDSNTFEVLYDGRGPYTDPALLRVEVQWSGGGAHLDGAGFTTSRYGTPHSELLAVPSSGPLRVSARLVTSAGDTLGAVDGQLELQSGFKYDALVVVDSIEPVGVCISIADRAPVGNPNDGEPGADSLFLTLGGLPEGAIC